MKLYQRLLSQIISASLLCTSGCYRHTLRPEVVQELERLLHTTCSAETDQPFVPHADTFYFFAHCQRDPQLRCKALIAAADCGHEEAEYELQQIPSCYLSARSKRLDFKEDEVVTFSDYYKRAHECGYTTERTTFGYITWPIIAVIGIPIIIIGWPLKCLLFMQCAAPWNQVEKPAH